MTDMNSISKIKQFKLSNDDEILCEVIQHATDDNSAMIVRGVVKIIVAEDFRRGMRLYAFRPWMGFADDPAILQTLNSNHVIGEVTPVAEIVKQYKKTVTNLKKKLLKKSMPMDEVAPGAESMSDDEFEDLLDSMMERVKANENDSSSTSNIIRFKPKTIH
tara:strand:+ start:254 stop:736 length:483 start_codon:yes stop_codon:yes gene_type:complete